MRIASLNEHLTWKSYKLVVFLSLRIFIFLLRSITKPRLRYVDNVPDFTPKYSVAILRTTNSVGFSTESCWRKRQKGTRFQRRHAKTNCLYAANLVVSFAFVSLSAMINVSYFSMYVYMYNILVLFLSLYWSRLSYKVTIMMCHSHGESHHLSTAKYVYLRESRTTWYRRALTRKLLLRYIRRG